MILLKEKLIAELIGYGFTKSIAGNSELDNQFFKDNLRIEVTDSGCILSVIDFPLGGKDPLYSEKKRFRGFDINQIFDAICDFRVV